MHEIRSTVLKQERRVPLADKASARNGARAADGGLAGVRIRRQETRTSNQRSEDRHVNLVDRATIRCQRKTHTVEVLNVSSRGAMVRAEFQPRIGARIDISFADCDRLQAVVRWVRDDRIGLEFLNETLILAPADVRELIVSGRRYGEQQSKLEHRSTRPPRHRFMLKGELHSRYGSMAVKLRNISADGAMLEGSDDLMPELEVVLTIAGVEALPARVRWSRGGQIGIRFNEPIDLRRLAQPQSEAERQSPDMLKPDYLRSETDPNSPWAAQWDRFTPDNL